MFIESDGEVKIELHIKKGGNGSMRVETDLNDRPEEEKVKYEKCEFKLRPLTWKQHNDIQRAATINRGTGMGSELDWVLYKERKLCTVLVGWDAKSKEGKPVPVNDTNIFRLCPQVAEALLTEFDKATILGEEERKNS